MGWSHAIWPILCLINPIYGWILGGNRFVYHNNRHTCLFSQPENIMALPSLLEYNSSAGEVAFMPFPGTFVDFAVFL